MITHLDTKDIPGLIQIITNNGDDRELEIDFEKLEDYTLLKIKDYVSRCNVPQEEPETKKDPLDKNSKLQRAEKRSNNRLNDIEKQIKAVEKSKDINAGRVVAVNPSEEEHTLGFWLCKVTEISNIKEGKVKVQWFEYVKDDEKNSDVKFFELVNNYDIISVNSIFTELNIRLDYNSEKSLYILNDYKRVMEDIQKLDSEM